MSKLHSFSSSRHPSRPCLILFSCLFFWTPIQLLAAPQGRTSSEIDRRWDAVFGDQAVKFDQAPESTAAPAPSDFQNFADQIFYRLSVDYVHNFVSFTGDPTRTLIVDDGPPFTMTPEGYFSFPPMFESSDHKIYSRATFGTRGFGHGRLRTEVSLISYHDLNGTSAGSPFQSGLDTFGGRSRTEAL